MNQTDTPAPPVTLPLPGYPNYSITPSGDVWRVTAASRGPFSGYSMRRVVPSIHPRGHQWYVHLTGSDGKRARVRVSLLVESVAGLFPIDKASPAA